MPEPTTATFDRADKLLAAWGRECRTYRETLRSPGIRSISQVQLRIRERERELRRERKKALRRKHREARRTGLAVDAREVAEVLGYADPAVSAQGKQPPQPAVTPKLELHSELARVDAVIRRLPGWMRECIEHTYLEGEPDRVAADNMRMAQGEYAQRRRAAVERVAALLAERLESPASPAGRT